MDVADDPGPGAVSSDPESGTSSLQLSTSTVSISSCDLASSCNLIVVHKVYMISRVANKTKSLSNFLYQIIGMPS